MISSERSTVNITAEKGSALLRTVLRIVYLIIMYLMLNRAFLNEFETGNIITCILFILFIAALKIGSSYDTKKALIIDILTVLFFFMFVLYLFRDYFLAVLTVTVDRNIADPDLVTYINRIMMLPSVFVSTIFFRSFFIQKERYFPAIFFFAEVLFIIFADNVVLYRYLVPIVIIILTDLYYSYLEEGNDDIGFKMMMLIPLAACLLISLLSAGIINMIEKPSWMKTIRDLEIFNYDYDSSHYSDVSAYPERDGIESMNETVFELYTSHALPFIKKRSINPFPNNIYADPSLYGIDDLSDYYYDLLTDEHADSYYEIKGTKESYYVSSTLSRFDGKTVDDLGVIFNISSNRYRIGFNADKSVGNDQKYAAYAHDNYTYLPDDLKVKLEAYLDEQGISKEEQDKTAIIRNILQIFNKEMTYSLKNDTQEPDVISFLNETKKGKCLDFAYAAAALFRTCSIPCNIAIGYPGPFPKNRTILVKGPSHAWCEIYVDDYGWVSLDVTTGVPDDDYAFAKYEGDMSDLKDYPMLNVGISGIISDDDYYSGSAQISQNKTDDAYYELRKQDQKQSDIRNERYAAVFQNVFLVTRYLVIVLVLLGIAVMIILFSGTYKRFGPDLRQQIHNYYLLFEHYDHLDEQIMNSLRRMRFSPIRENRNDLRMMEFKYDLLLNGSQEQKHNMFRRNRIRLYKLYLDLLSFRENLLSSLKKEKNG